MDLCTCIFLRAHSPLVSIVPSLPHYVSFQAIETGSGILGYHPCWCLSPFSLCLLYLGTFPFTLLHLPLDFIRISSLRPTYLHPVGRPITYSLFCLVFRQS